MNIELIPDLPEKEAAKGYFKSSIGLMAASPTKTVLMVIQAIIVTACVLLPLHHLLMSAGDIAGYFGLSESEGKLIFLYGYELTQLLIVSGPLWLIVMMNHLRCMDVGANAPTVVDDLRACLKVCSRVFSSGFMVFAIMLFSFKAVLMLNAQDVIQEPQASLVLAPTTEYGYFLQSLSRMFTFGISVAVIPTLAFFIFHGLRSDLSESLMAAGGSGIRVRNVKATYVWLIITCAIYVLIARLGTYLAHVFGTDYAYLALALTINVLYAGFFYAFCVDKIEGRKLESKQSDRVQEGEPEAV